MTILSNGLPSTLGSWRIIAADLYGEASEPVRFLDEEIARAVHGSQQEVLPAEDRMLAILARMNEVSSQAPSTKE